MRNRLNVDIPSLGAGAAIAVVGALVLLDSSGAFELSLGWMAVALTAALGVILVLSGLARQPEQDDD
jgi:hypothetical protein